MSNTTVLERTSLNAHQTVEKDRPQENTVQKIIDLTFITIYILTIIGVNCLIFRDRKPLVKATFSISALASFPLIQYIDKNYPNIKIPYVCNKKKKSD